MIDNRDHNRDRDALNEFGNHALKQSRAKPLTAADIQARELVPFQFVGGPADGSTLWDSEAFTRDCHEDAGRTFDRENPTGHGPSCTCESGVVHQYRTDFDRQCYIYVGPMGTIDLHQSP